MGGTATCRKGALAFLLLVGLAACGGDGGGSSPTSPATPSPPPAPPPTPLSWLDVPTDVQTVRIGGTFVVTVRLSAAVQHTDRFTWNDDHVTVEAVVLRPGVVQLTITGVGAGESTITLFAEAPGYQAAEASFTVEVWNPEEFYVDVAEWVERYWSFRFPEVGATYRPIGAFQGYDSPISTPCGPAEPGDAFYCSINRGIYYDTAFFADYLDRVGQMAPAVIIAHEFGHHVSWELGSREINSLKQRRVASGLPRRRLGALG